MRPIATIDEVAIACQDEHQLVIDVRDAYRYRGESEPLDPVAGHIPGAVNIPLTGNLDTKGKFLSPEELFSYYKRAIGSRDIENVIVHCGSGVTACHTLLALERAEIVGAKLYVGSWSEWCRSGRPIQTGSDPI
jgi:thiosulfate/3-mercaptopyruvate sulfurtransferase